MVKSFTELSITESFPVIDKKNPKSSANCWAIVPAAGIGSRMGTSCPKQYLLLNEQPLINYSLQRLLETPWIKGIVVAIAEHDTHWEQLAISNHRAINTVTGGARRVDSVANALDFLQNKLLADDYILVHDAARPCLGKDDLDKLYSALETTQVGVVLADRLSDTVKRDDGNHAVLKTVPRTGLWRALTPQVFAQRILSKAIQEAHKGNINEITDESSAVEQLGLSPQLVQGNTNNIKVTTEGDLPLASLILKAQSQTKKEQDKCE